MTLIEERPARQDHAVAQPDVTVEDGPRTTGEQLSGRWVAVLTGAWVAIFGLGVALEPAPTGEEDLPLVATAFALALMGCWAAMAAGFLARRRSGALASVAGAACLVAMTIGCPISGHHSGIGAWWGFQLVGSLTLVGLSRSALASHPPR